jgi:hypothetical protein
MSNATWIDHLLRSLNQYGVFDHLTNLALAWVTH